MIRDARGDQQVIRQATQQALSAWFRQSERLNIARREYRLRGPRFNDFARRIGITDQTSAYYLVQSVQDEINRHLVAYGGASRRFSAATANRLLIP